MGGIRLIALDMDGTLLDSGQRISEENRTWIGRARQAGIGVVLASGRRMAAMLPYIRELGLEGPVVAVNGSEVWETPERLLERHLLDHRDVVRLQDLALEQGVWYWAYAVGGLYNPEGWCGNPAEEQWLKFGYSCEDAGVLERIRRTVEAWGTFAITNSSPTNLELNPLGISKRAGLERICRLLGIGMNEVMAVGDSLNDIEMIRAAGLGVAMANAQEAVLAAADRVAGHHENSGVAQAIREWALGG